MTSADPFELQLLKLHEKVRGLEEVNSMQTEAIKELTRMLHKSKPHPRPTLSAEKKLYVAGLARFRCADPLNNCPLKKIGDGSFTEHGFEIDHVVPFAKSWHHSGNLRALCPYCHALVSRWQRMQDVEDQAEDGDE